MQKVPISFSNHSSLEIAFQGFLPTFLFSLYAGQNAGWHISLNGKTSIHRQTEEETLLVWKKSDYVHYFMVQRQLYGYGICL